MRDFKKYDIWHLAMRIVNEVYTLSKSFPQEEKYGLTSQIKRSAVSIPSNIAEGCCRESDKAFKRFLEIAIGSAFELETQLIIALNQKYIDNISETITQLNKLKASMNSLRNKLKE